MIPRKRLDLTWSDILFGITQCFWPKPLELIQPRLENLWSSQETCLACLSVRSGFDAMLSVLNFPTGSEILVSAITIRDMTRILEKHGLVPIPVDLDMEKLTVRLDLLKQAVTPQTRAILIAHLFGSRMPMTPIVRLAQEHHLFLIEDCAQAFTGGDYRGHPDSDVSMFSFGPIKTATALGGGLLRFKHANLCHQVRQLQSQWPLQTRRQLLVRLGKFAVLHGLSYRPMFSLFTIACRCLRINHDTVISDKVRGFTGDNWLAKIRHQPSSPLLTLLEHRIKNLGKEDITKRIAVAQQAIHLLPTVERPGSQADFHTHWVFPIQHEAPEPLMQHLWTKGFDATRGASSLSVVEPPAQRPETTPTEVRKVFEEILYLPVYVGVSIQELEKLARIVNGGQ
jgi:perosamine synthetase